MAESDGASGKKGSQWLSTVGPVQPLTPSNIMLHLKTMAESEVPGHCEHLLLAGSEWLSAVVPVHPLMPANVMLHSKTNL